MAVAVPPEIPPSLRERLGHHWCTMWRARNPPPPRAHTIEARMNAARQPKQQGGPERKKKSSATQFSPKSPRVLHGGVWRLVAVGGWRLVVGGGWWLAGGGLWRLAAVGGWRLVVPGGGLEGRSLATKN